MALRGGLQTETGCVGVEGVRLVEEALRSGCRIEAVLFGESGERHRERLAPFVNRPEMGFPVLRTTDRLFEGIADTEHPQGVAALVAPRVSTLDDLLRAPGEACSALLVVLAGVQDPGNVGTILRTASAFGVTGAVTAASGQSGTASPFSPKALRASAGAALHLSILAGMSLPILLTQLRVAGIRTLASSVHEPRDGDSPLLAPWDVDWCEPVALLVGNEGAGLPEEVERSADARIRIPMASGIESLNAAAAAAVLFYEAARQRKTLPARNELKP
jgi:TrmH family RNA methyltransferase